MVATARARVQMLVPRDQFDELRMEVDSLQTEARQIGDLLPHARAVHLYVLGVGESVEAVQSASHVAYHIERIARRHGK